MNKPIPKNVPLLNLDKCLEYAQKEKVITKEIADEIVDYARSLGIEAGYWDLHWMDIEEENGMDHPDGFRKFYDLFKEHEVKDKEYPHLHFDVGVYS